MYRLVVVLFIVVGGAFAKAQNVFDLFPKIEQLPREISDTLNRPYDDQNVEVRDFAQNFQDKYQSNDFNYITTPGAEGSNFISRIINQFFDWLRVVFGFTIPPFWKDFIKYTVYFLLLAAVVYVVLIFLKKDDASGLIVRDDHRLQKAAVAINGQEQTIDLQKLVQEHIQSGQYREAVRYLYLNSLAILHKAQIIKWEERKTNTDYIFEITDRTLKGTFKKVSYLYDYVWYGEFEPDQQQFEEMRKSFVELEKQLGNG